MKIVTIFFFGLELHQRSVYLVVGCMQQTKSNSLALADFLGANLVQTHPNMPIFGTLGYLGGQIQILIFSKLICINLYYPRGTIHDLSGAIDAKQRVIQRYVKTQMKHVRLKLFYNINVYGFAKHFLNYHTSPKCVCNCKF